MAIRTQKIAVTLAGANGAASGNAATGVPLNGRLVAVYIDVTSGSQPNTTDVTITTVGNNSPAQTLLAATNVASSAWYYPTLATQDAIGGAATFDGAHGLREGFPVDDYIKAAGAQGNAGALNVYVIVEY